MRTFSCAQSVSHLELCHPRLFSSHFEEGLLVGATTGLESNLPGFRGFSTDLIGGVAHKLCW